MPKYHDNTTNGITVQRNGHPNAFNIEKEPEHGGSTRKRDQNQGWQYEREQKRSQVHRAKIIAKTSETKKMKKT